MKSASTSIVWSLRVGQQSRQPGHRHSQYAAGRGIRYETLFRDETVGALDAVNGKEYVRMLRRAMDLGGFHQVIFICHTPLVWELADEILCVGGTGVVIGNREAGVTPLHK
jgi:ABC-type glutathione transport system ATPase component